MSAPAILICLTLLFSPSAAAQQIYRYLDDNGNPVFSQQPSASGKNEIIRLEPPNLSRPIIRTGSELLPTPQPARHELPYRMVNPQISEDQVLRANGGMLEIDVLMQPALQVDHRLLALLDGQPAGEPAATQRITLTDVSRGQQQLVIQVVNDQGRVVHETQPVRFTILRHSRLHDASS